MSYTWECEFCGAELTSRCENEECDEKRILKYHTRRPERFPVAYTLYFENEDAMADWAARYSNSGEQQMEAYMENGGWDWAEIRVTPEEDCGW